MGNFDMLGISALLADNTHTFLETGGNIMEWLADHTVGVLVFPWDEPAGAFLNTFAITVVAGILIGRLVIRRWD